LDVCSNSLMKMVIGRCVGRLNRDARSDPRICSAVDRDYRHPTAEWVARQITEAWRKTPNYLLRDMTVRGLQFAV
jgi:hypothetical protein